MAAVQTIHSAVLCYYSLTKWRRQALCSHCENNRLTFTSFLRLDKVEEPYFSPAQVSDCQYEGGL